MNNMVSGNFSPEEWECIPEELRETYARLRTWHGRAWVMSQGSGNYPSRPVALDTPNSRLSAELWEELQTLIRSTDALVTFGMSEWGFTLAMMVEHHVAEMYPGVRLDPILVAVVHQHHLPRPLRGPDGRFIRGGGRFDDGWRYFSPFTNSECMRARRASFGLGDPPEKRHLDY